VPTDGIFLISDLCTTCVQEGGFEGPEYGPKQRRINNRLLSYRPLQNLVAIAYNSFSLRCLSVIRNCVQIHSLCTRQQFLYHFPFLSVLQMRVSCS
jgi:hypothetical protein